MKEQIKQALEKVTPGEWKGKHAINPYITRFNGVADEIIATVPDRKNLELLANAPTWLRWQNERIEELEREVNAAKLEARNERILSEDIVAERERLYIRVEEMENALKFYADENSYVDSIGSMEIEPTVMIDKGEWARKALKGAPA